MDTLFNLLEILQYIRRQRLMQITRSKQQACKMSEPIRIHVLVSGRVQGVYYRASTREQALQLGLTGWVRNLSDGRVEFEAQGPAAQVNRLIAWAGKGPDHAKVDSVVQKEIPSLPGEKSFQITR